jgi:putative phosphoesterase
MKIAFFSDIHGNLPALEIAIKETMGVDGYVILGDVVNYGPWSNDCVKMIEELQNCKKILGNHEEFFIDGKCNCEGYLPNEFFNQCYTDFKEITAIQNYEKEFEFENFTCTHTLYDKYIFQDTIISIDKNYIIGHSHRQYKIVHNGFTLLNPGSVGQNRQFINEINFMIYDTKLKKEDFRSILYDDGIVIKKMEKMGYPQICIDYYIKKPRK